MAPSVAPELHPRDGFWGKSTSTINFCEENYVISYYVAEFWNTVTCLALIVPPMVGIFRCQVDRLEPRYTLSYLATLGVGLGSVLFHGTLLFEMELLDVIPMMVLVSILVYCLIDLDGQYNTMSSRGYYAGMLLTIYMLLFTVIFIANHSFTFFEISFLLLCVTLLVVGSYQFRRHGLDKHLKWTLVYIGMLLFAWLIWNVDTRLCPSVREVRQSMPFGEKDCVTQLHGWWHVLTGLGTYLHIMSSSRIRMEILGYNTAVKTCLGLPYLTVQRRLMV